MVTLTGPARKPVNAQFVRQLTEEDRGVLAEDRRPSTQRLQRLTSRHHALARYIALGYSRENAAILAGYATITVNSVFMNDPSFLELVTFYREQETGTVRDLQEKMLGIGLEAAELLQQRMEEQPDKLTVGQLLEIHKTMADRTGNGPRQVTETNVNISIGERLNAAKHRLKLIEGTKNENPILAERVNLTSSDDNVR